MWILSFCWRTYERWDVDWTSICRCLIQLCERVKIQLKILREDRDQDGKQIDEVGTEFYLTLVRKPIETYPNPALRRVPVLPYFSPTFSLSILTHCRVIWYTLRLALACRVTFNQSYQNVLSDQMTLILCSISASCTDVRGVQTYCSGGIFAEGLLESRQPQINANPWYVCSRAYDSSYNALYTRLVLHVTCLVCKSPTDMNGL